MADINISENISKLLSELESKMEDMTPAFKDIADYEWGQTRMRYVNQEDPEGAKWQDPFTVRRDGGGVRSQQFRDPWPYVVASNYKAAPPGYHFFDAGRGDKILRDTGTMFNSIGRAYGPDYALVGTDIEYATKHQEGIGVKKREFLGINQKTYDNVKNVVEFYLMGVKK